MDAIAGLFSENGIIVLILILAAIGVFWLFSRFFKLTIVVVAVILALLALQHYSPSGELKTKFKEVVERVSGKAYDVKDRVKEFFSGQKDKMHKHMNEALNNEDKKEADTGSRKK